MLIYLIFISFALNELNYNRNVIVNQFLTVFLKERAVNECIEHSILFDGAVITREK